MMGMQYVTVMENYTVYIMRSYSNNFQTILSWHNIDGNQSRNVLPIKVKMRNIGSMGIILRVVVLKFNYGLSDVVAFTISLAGVFNNDANASVIIFLSNIITVYWQSVEQ